LVAVFAPPLVHAKEYTVGVKAGDWVKYGQITFNWTGNGTEPSYATEFKKIDWSRLDIIKVTGAIASLNATIHFNNGTQIVQSYDADVQNGTSEGNTFLIGSNLIAGDPINPATSEAKINQTVVRIYAGANRNVNVVDLQNNVTIGTVSIQGESRSYWDQNTGVLVEVYINQTDPTNSNAYFTESLKATETNLWSASAFDLIQNNLFYIIVGITVIIVIVAAAIILQRRKHSPPQQPPPPSAPVPPPSRNSAR
jgi:hypothetical protein